MAQEERHVLFIGNSYTAVNNLPQMVANIAENMGDHLIYSSNTPGGCTLQQHCNNGSMTLICQGGWDAVVLQEQSQLPSFPQNQVETEVFPYAKRLVDSIYRHNPCAEPMFYMTWGRKNGDSQNAHNYPVLETYEGMDSMLCERYTYMANTYDAALCPVGRIWRYLRKNHPEIELYDRDGSHPSTEGTYAAACAFYVMLFRHNPDGITYSADLDPNTASLIRGAVRTIVFNSLPEWKRPLPQALFTIDTMGLNVTLTSYSLYADSLQWDFGDGSQVETGDSICHTYPDSGTYTIRLIASRHCMTDTATSTLHLTHPNGDNNSIVIPDTPAIQLFPNPTHSITTLQLPENQSNATITLFTIEGHLIWQRNDNTPTVTLDFHRFATGEYLLQIDLPDRSFVYRIIKN